MTKEQRDLFERIENAIDRAIRTRGIQTLALGWLRYEALRRLTPQQFAELHRRNLEGASLDDLATDAVLEHLAP